MKEILDALLAALAAGESAMLCSVLAADGSSPRGSGARMAVLADGTSLGTVGGGAVERQTLDLARSLLAEGRDALRTFSLHPEGENATGMVCGGEVTILLHCLTPESGAAETLRAWRAALDAGESVWLRTALEGERVGEFSLLTAGDLCHGAESFCTAQPYWDGQLSVEPIVRALQVYLFGAGHVARALVPVLHYVGFEVTVFDERAERATRERFPDARTLILGDFRDIFERVTLTADDYAVVMTPGHQADYEILEQLLRTDATYIGCIGSRKKVALTREKLTASGFATEQIDRIHAPIGLPILAETPEEIAVSIAAEMIRHRAALLPSPHHRK